MPKPRIASYQPAHNHSLVIARRRSRRSNPEPATRTLDCFASLAMTVNHSAGWYHTPNLADDLLIPAKARIEDLSTATPRAYVASAGRTESKSNVRIASLSLPI